MRTGVPASPYSVMRPPVSGWLMSTERPVNCSVPTPLSDSAPSVTRAVARPGSWKPPARRPSLVKICTRSRPFGRVGDHEGAVGLGVEGGRFDDAAVFAADGDELAGARRSAVTR